MAIGIIAVVIVQTVSIESSSLSITQTTRNQMRAVWAMRQVYAQMEYVVDALGTDGLPKSDLNLGWSGDEQFTVNLLIKDSNLEASRLLTSAMKLSQGMNTEEAPASGEKQEDASTQDSQMKEFGALLDSKLPKDLFRTVAIKVTWKEAGADKSINSGSLIIDEKKVVAIFDQASATAKALGAGGASGATGGAGGATGATGAGSGGAAAGSGAGAGNPTSTGSGVGP